MSVQIVSDSSANITKDNILNVKYAPLKIVNSEHEYVDDDNLDVSAMLAELKTYKGKSGTTCPSIDDWINTFNGADEVYGIAITSGLSGSYNSGVIATQHYMEENPGKKAFILDSLATGPELTLILEKYRELIDAGKSFEEICAEAKAYHPHTRLIFALGSLDNLARNGRVSPLVAKVAGMLGIRIVGTTTDEGTLDPLHKCRGEKKSLEQMVEMAAGYGFKGGKARITHTLAEATAGKLRSLILDRWPDADVQVSVNRGLCSFYAEEGSVLLGIEY